MRSKKRRRNIHENLISLIPIFVFQTNSYKMRVFKYFIFLFVIATLTSCTQEPPILKEKTEFGKAGWNRFKYLEYSPEIVDNSVPYIFTLKMEFTEEYEHNYFKIQLSKESGGESYVKIFSIPVKDREGVFLEKVENGVSKVSTILSQQIYFSSPGKYQIIIEELMPPYYLKGVKSAEFIIKKRTK